MNQSTTFPHAIYGKAVEQHNSTAKVRDYDWVVRDTLFPQGINADLQRYTLFSGTKDLSKDRPNLCAVGFFALNKTQKFIVQSQVSERTDHEDRLIQMTRFFYVGDPDRYTSAQLVRLLFALYNERLTVFTHEVGDFRKFEFPDVANSAVSYGEAKLKKNWEYKVMEQLLKGNQVLLEGEPPIQGDVGDKVIDWRSGYAFELYDRINKTINSGIPPFISLAVGDVNPSTATSYDIVITHGDWFKRPAGNVAQFRVSLNEYLKDATVSNPPQPDNTPDNANVDYSSFLNRRTRTQFEHVIYDKTVPEAQGITSPPVQQQQPIQTSPSPYDQPTMPTPAQPTSSNDQPTVPTPAQPTSSNDQPTVPTPAQPSERIKDIPPASRDKLPPANHQGTPPFLKSPYATSKNYSPPASTSGPVPAFVRDSSYSGKPAQPPTSAPQPQKSPPSNRTAQFGNSQPSSTKSTHKHRRPSPRQGRQDSRGIIILFIILFIVVVALVLAMYQRNTQLSSPDVTMTADPRTQTAIVYALTSIVQAEFLAATQTAQANILTQTQQAEFLAATQTAQANILTQTQQAEFLAATQTAQANILTQTQQAEFLAATQTAQVNQTSESTSLSIIAATAAQETLQAISAQAPTAPPTPLPTNSPIAYAFVTGDGLEGICLNLRSAPVILTSNLMGEVPPNDAYAIYEISSYATQTENINFLRIHSSQQYWVAERSGTSSEIAVVQYPDIGSLIEAHPTVVGFSNDELVEALSTEARNCSGQ